MFSKNAVNECGFLFCVLQNVPNTMQLQPALHNVNFLVRVLVLGDGVGGGVPGKERLKMTRLLFAVCVSPGGQV